jgi:Mn-dependent DtxR family transcriptional regulator
MEQTLTISIQDYLKNIYELTENGESASTNALAAKLRIKPASVTGMVQKLASAKPALVEYHKHQGVTLTREGKKAALEVIRHHRLIETWLVQNCILWMKSMKRRSDSNTSSRRISKGVSPQQWDIHSATRTANSSPLRI